MKKTGLIIGKFMPLHRGHCFLIDVASQICHSLHICVGSKKSDPIDGELRCQWLRTQYPSSHITIHHITKEIPQAHPSNPNAPKIWSKELRTHLTDIAIDYIFASEPYVKTLAQHLDAKFVMLDPTRSTVDISGKDIRQHVYSNWNYLAPPVKNHLVKNISVQGPEKIVLTLAETFGALYYHPLSQSNDFLDNSLSVQEKKQVIEAKMNSLKQQDYPILLCHLPNPLPQNQLFLHELTFFEQTFICNTISDIDVVLQWWQDYSSSLQWDE